ncbi:hypothetical protein BgAZ_302550 [Babesia gibsoni]|uniref:DNA recombination and repair protein Rad51-like C-terminal domain-containing protein n=1 Tax=Babesia gibsoni TaxID=33632 RepID=A0AAD8LQW6_BABGI|nr:hypothetical protein BgAZ_302550 [Babesia gibsoni]
MTEEPFRFANGNYQEISESALSFVHRYSRESLENLAKKRCMPTQSTGLNKVLSGGIYTQELTEVVGDNHMHNGELILHLLVHQLHCEKDSEAVIVTSNGSQNEETIYRITHRYIESQRGIIGLNNAVDADDIAFGIMKRVYIVHCLDINELSLILDEILNGHHRKQMRLKKRLMTGVEIGSLHKPTGKRPGKPNADDFVATDAVDHQDDTDPQHKSQISTLVIHQLSSMVGDSHGRDAWNRMPEICSKLRSTAFRLNTAIIISNHLEENSNTASSAAEETDDHNSSKYKAVDWVMSSTKWNSTVDKRLEITSNQQHKDKRHVKFDMHLTKSKHSAVPMSCHLTLSENGR